MCPNIGKPNQIAHQVKKPPVEWHTHHCTNGFKPQHYSYCLRLPLTRVVLQRLLELASIWADNIQCYYLLQHSYYWFCYISAIKEPAQPIQPDIWALLVLYLHFVLFPFLSIPHHPPNVGTPDTTSLVQLTRFSIIFGRNFYKQQQVLGKLLKTVKWSVFNVSFIHVLTILGRL